jgi:hypothetical protein
MDMDDAVETDSDMEAEQDCKTLSHLSLSSNKNLINVNRGLVSTLSPRLFHMVRLEDSI